MLAAAAVTVFMVSSASAAFRSYSAEDFIDSHGSVTLTGRGGGGFRGGGGGFRGGGRSFSRGGSRGFRGGSRGGHRSFSRGSRGSHSASRSRGRNFARPSHLGSHHGSHTSHLGSHASHDTHGTHDAHGSHGTHGFNRNAHVGTGHVGQVMHGKYGSHNMSHKVLGNRHRGLMGHNAHRPGNHLRNRLSHLHGHHWHSHFKHVVIVGGFGGDIYCDLCEFDVPVDVYGDFVAAIDEADDADVEAAAYVGEEAAYADVPPEDLPARRVERSHGWSKAVAILEEKAVEEDAAEAEAAKSGTEVEAVVDEPDETVDVVADPDPKKG